MKGSKYEATKNLKLKDCLKLARKDVRRYLASPKCTIKGATLKSCRIGGSGRSVQIELAFPNSAFDFSSVLKVQNSALHYAPSNLYKPYGVETRMTDVITQVKSIISEYNRDDSDPMTDYSSYRFLVFISVNKPNTLNDVCDVFEDLCAELGWNPEIPQDTYPGQVVEFLEMHTGGLARVTRVEETAAAQGGQS